MSLNFQLTHFEPVYPIVEQLYYTLNGFDKTPRDPRAAEIVEKLLILIQSRMKELKDDVSREPKHAMIWKGIYNSIKRLHTAKPATAKKIQDAIGYIIQSKLPVELSAVNPADHSIFILTSELNNCFDSLIMGQNIEENLKYAARILVEHYRFFRDLELSGKSPLNDRQKEEIRKILDSCKKGMKILATNVPVVKSHPFFQKLEILIFQRLERRNWNDRFITPITINILRFLPAIQESTLTIMEFLSQNPQDGYQALAAWINYNHIPLNLISNDPKKLKHLQPYLQFVDFGITDWDANHVYDFIQNCVKIKHLIIRTSELSLLPPRVQQLTSLNCSQCDENLIRLPDDMRMLKELTCSWKIQSLPSGMNSLLKLHVVRNSEDIYDETTGLTTLPKGMTSLVELDIFNCHQITSLPNDLHSLKKLDMRECFKVVEIPENLIHLTVLFCDENTQITKLPSSMQSLKVLSCSNTNLVKLPPGMTSLSYLNCRFNPTITSKEWFPTDLRSLIKDQLYLGVAERNFLPSQYVPVLNPGDFTTRAFTWDDFDIHGNKIPKVGIST